MGRMDVKALRRAVFVLAVAVGAGPARPAAARGEADVLREDVQFLLEELPKKARDLLRDKDIDWKKATKSLAREAKKLRDPVEYVRLVERILARLQDGHAGIVKLAPDLEATLGAANEAEAKGRRFTGPRVHLVLAGDEVLVGEAFGEAAEAGVKVGMQVVEIDDVPARTWVEKKADELADKNGYSTRHAALHAACHWGLATWEGTPIRFELREGSDRKKVTITRRGGPNFAPSGPACPPADLKQVGRQSYGKTASGYGYIHLRDVPDKLPQQLDEMLGALGDVPGLVLDMRANGGGGCDHEAVFGRFLASGTRWRQYTGQGAHPFTGPLVVIVDAGVRSAGETVAGMFKEDGRAYLIGPEPTAGMSSQKEILEVPSGKLAVRVSVSSNKGRFNGGKGIEGLGVPPNEVVVYDAKELLAGTDSQIRRAEALLRDGFPKGVVPYEPPAR
ncbi:MAG: S41 family peptidase [Planctomycetota bacterium]